MKIIRYSLLVLTTVTISFCKEDGRFLQSIIGSPFEVLVVFDKAKWEQESGKALFDVLNSDVPNLPQSEPSFNISHCSFQDFNSLLKPTRNIVLVEIDPTQYTRANVKYMKNIWADPQAVIKITAADDSSFVRILKEKKNQIIEYFNKAERDRFYEFAKDNRNPQIVDMIHKQFNIQLDLPRNIDLYKQGKDVLWISTGAREIRQDIVIYTYPYKSEKQLTKQALLRVSDSIARNFIAGPEYGSYVTKEYKYDMPSFTEKEIDGKYCAEIRALWKTEGNISMGGPFVSLTQIDEANQRVVTIEAMVFAPGENKRNHMKQLEAILYHAKLPVMLNEVEVVAKN